ncbi:nucleotide exchange factor GrpE [Campylobacter corcagiensis]|uniref:Protein GrpE n=1 Tax=Campylobacter corcagiensis TaxID=1448857 RepID=A0A7M1LFW9_9BACT|nr:nucleotide exchange factor GrpE [Campylobacter corcagiensis]QKF64876.1 DnaK system nucleotide exchange factor GrpE [Campylobacter corcagiensis]QOQ86964.1 nucleotide exchange factor GrpE [Campylobacter corcagiensis]
MKKEDIENLENSEENLENLEDSEAEISQTQSELDKLQNEFSELTDKFYRANADFENMKKRLEREKSVAVEYASEKFAKDLLPIVDALEEAIKIEVGDNELARRIEDGVERCLDIFLETFKKYGIEQVENSGEANPEFHNAINLVESKEHEKGEIVDVYQKGYKFKDRVLRASMVSVAK